MRRSHTLAEVFEEVARWHPDREAFVQAGGGPAARYTYEEAATGARQWASVLAEFGVERRDRVAFLARTTTEYALAYFGTVTLGAIPTTLHAGRSPDDLERMVERTTPGVVVFDPAFADAAAHLHEHTAIEVALALDGSGDLPAGTEDGRALRSAASPRTDPPVPESDDPAFINFTSGSTGVPKPIVHTHSDAVECAHVGQYFFSAHSGDTLLHVFTPSFIAWPNAMFPFVAVGARVVMLESFDAERAVDTIEREGVSVLYTVPTQIKLMLEAGLESADTSHVRRCGFGGETLNQTTIERLRTSVTENIFIEYGTTELMHSGTVLLPEQLNEETRDSVGRPLPGVQLRLIEPGSADPDAEVERGTVGELTVRGPSVADAVWNDPERTAQLFHEDGWWFSGDLGVVGPSGNLRIVGRADNTFKSGGQKVQAETVEDVLEMHPDVVEAAVVGAPDETYGNVVTAFVMARTDSLAEADLDRWCLERDELPDYQRPRRYVFRDELPRTNTGKLDRTPLREEVADG